MNNKNEIKEYIYKLIYLNHLEIETDNNIFFAI